jgi:hypothetical protein
VELVSQEGGHRRVAWLVSGAAGIDVFRMDGMMTKSGVMVKFADPTDWTEDMNAIVPGMNDDMVAQTFAHLSLSISEEMLERG